MCHDPCTNVHLTTSVIATMSMLQCLGYVVHSSLECHSKQPVFLSCPCKRSSIIQTVNLDSPPPPPPHTPPTLPPALPLPLPHAAIDCGDPGVPANGDRSFSSTLFNTVVNYSCNEGYELFGSQQRTCQVNEQWSQSLPECRRKLTANTMPFVLPCHSL